MGQKVVLLPGVSLRIRLLLGFFGVKVGRRGRGHPLLVGRGARGRGMLRFGVGSFLLELIGGLWDSATILVFRSARSCEVQVKFMAKPHSRVNQGWRPGLSCMNPGGRRALGLHRPYP